MPIDGPLHKLLVQPGVHNQSMLLGLLSHAEGAVRGVPHGETVADQAGRAISRAGEAVDFAIGHHLTGLKRVESIKLTSPDIKRLHEQVTKLDGGPTGPVRQRVEQALLDHNALLRAGRSQDPYNHHATLDSLVQLADADPHLEVHLRDVAIPSALGEGGKHLKHFATDAATMYGAAEIASKLNRLASEPGKRRRSTEESMNHLDKAAELFEKAAALLDTLPGVERSYELAEKLASEGLIERAEVEKRASIFANDPDGAEVMVGDMLKAAQAEKSASTFESPEDSLLGAGSGSSGSSDRRYSGFDAFCLGS